jgi:hypothetical protein
MNIIWNRTSILLAALLAFCALTEAPAGLRSELKKKKTGLLSMP